MKTHEQIERAAHAANNHAIREAEALLTNLRRLKKGVDPKRVMPNTRTQLANLNKYIHEANAYRNALETATASTNGS